MLDLTPQYTSKKHRGRYLALEEDQALLEIEMQCSHG